MSFKQVYIFSIGAIAIVCITSLYFVLGGFLSHGNTPGAMAQAHAKIEGS